MGFFNRSKKDTTPAKGEAKKDDAKKAAPAADAKKEVAAKAPAAPRSTGAAYKVLVRPIVTEKTTAEEKLGKYAFEVAMDANKIQVREAVKSVYGVMPTDVRMMRILGKPVGARTGRGRRSAWKKAIVTLKKGERIDLFANA